MNQFDKICEAAAYLQPYVLPGTKAGVVLGSGLGNFVQEIQMHKEIEYETIPHFPVSTVEGHHGKLIIGELAGKPILAMAVFINSSLIRSVMNLTVVSFFL